MSCGLGDIIRHIKAEHKYGYDISQNVIDCAKHLGGGCFSVGSCDVAAKELPDSIDVLVAVNWIHTLPSEEVKKLFDILLDAVEVDRIVIDALKSQYPDAYQHNLDEMFPKYVSSF